MMWEAFEKIRNVILETWSLFRLSTAIFFGGSGKEIADNVLCLWAFLPYSRHTR